LGFKRTTRKKKVGNSINENVNLDVLPHTKKDRIRKGCIGVASIEEKMTNQL